MKITVAEVVRLVGTPHHGVTSQRDSALSQNKLWMQTPWLGHAVAQGTGGDIHVPWCHCFPCHQLQTWLSICHCSSIQIVLHKHKSPQRQGFPTVPWGQRSLSWGQGRGSCPLPPTPGRGKHHKISSGSSTHKLPPAGGCIKVRLIQRFASTTDIFGFYLNSSPNDS